MFHDGLGRILSRGELTLDVSWGEPPISVNVYQVHVRLVVTQQGQFLTGLPELRCKNRITTGFVMVYT